MSSEKKIWLVTGATRGLGFETVKAALDSGHKVVAGARNPADLDAKLQHPNLAVIPLDVSDPNTKDIIARAVQPFGRLDVLVNNVGQGLTAAVEETSDAERLSLYDTNVFAPLRLIRAILPHFRGQGSGHIINITSAGSFSAGPGSGDYCATKAALRMESDGLQKELKPLGINVTVVAPGGFRTDFAGSASMKFSETEIADYGDTVGAQRANKFSGSGKEPSDPTKFGAVMVALVEMQNPPFDLPVGKDSVEVMVKTAAARMQAANAHLELSLSTALDTLCTQENRADDTQKRLEQ